MAPNLRREARLGARIKVLAVRGRTSEPLETTDVSFKGLFLRTDNPPPLRSLVRLKVSLPSRDIEAHAMVVHVSGESAPSLEAARERGCGLQFWGLAGPDRNAWDEFIRYLMTHEKKPKGESGVRITAASSASDAASEPPPSPPRAATR